MIPAEFDYVAPDTLDEALAALRDGGEDAKVLAGGHSLIPLMKLRLSAPSLIVDLRKLGMDSVSRDNGTARFGAMVRHHVVATGGFGIASAAAATIADQQVRNMGTIGGTLVHGDPASDMPAVLLACDGSVVARGASGEREIAGARHVPGLPDDRRGRGRDRHRGPPAPDLRLRLRYQKFNRRQEDWAMVAVCALVKKAGDGSCEDVRIGLTHMGSAPLRATAAEDALRGQGLSAESIAAAAEQAAEGTDPGRPERVGRLQAPPRARAHPARAGGCVTMK